MTILRWSAWITSSLALASLTYLPLVHADENYFAHEWGTFTSVQGSDGRLLEGLQHEEEPLPDFVYGRDGFTTAARTSPQVSRPHPGMTKRFEVALLSGTPTAVTQKLETPVIYFYSKKPRKVSVDVRFPGGVISQWYPKAESFAPAIGDIRSLEGGSMSWTVDVASPHASLDVPFVRAEDVWAPARQVASNYVSAGSENEKFIFYRGLGRFDVPVRVTSDSTGLTIHNESHESIPAAVLLHVQNGRGSVRALGSVAAGSALRAGALPKDSLKMSDYLTLASGVLKGSLIGSGLFADEAQAMVDTWSRSYFQTEGTRILYVLPRAWTDRILPIRLNPQPRQLVRTLVGRVEIMTSGEETVLVSEIEKASQSKKAMDLSRLGRFAEPKLRRAQQLTKDQDARQYEERLLRALN